MSLLPLSEQAVATLTELVAEYHRTHGCEVWLWQRLEDDWALVAGTSEPAGPKPGRAAAPLPSFGGVEAAVEVSATTPGAAREMAGFLALIFGRALKFDAESRFFGRELAERYEEITLLYTISEILGSVISLEEAAGRILQEVVDTLSVGRAALWVYDVGSASLELVAAVGEDGQAGPIRVDDAASITAAVFRNRRPMILEAGDVFPREDELDRPVDRESFLSVPVSYTPPQGEPRTVGVINLIGRSVDDGFSAGDQKLITAIASQIGAAVENNRLVAESLRQERLEREMELAHDLQLKLLPSVEPFQEFAEVAARCSPADSVGGDFYNLFRLPGSRLGVMIADVSSHGFAAALIMALSMSAVAIHASEGDPPAEVLRRVHRALIDELENTEMYLTLFYGVIDPLEGRLTYANAGHSHAFRMTPDGEMIRLSATSPPLGIVDLDSYAEECVPWVPGDDVLILFTDGLPDSLGQSGGEQALLREVTRRRGEPLASVLDAVFGLRGGGVQAPGDDRTALFVRL
jgi:phosphoserine phosphatase RsbU/P